MESSRKTFSVRSPYLRREFVVESGVISALSYTSLPDGTQLIDVDSANEGSVLIDGRAYALGSDFAYDHHLVSGTRDGGERLEIVLRPPSPLPDCLTVKIVHELSGAAAVATTFIRIENDSDRAVHLDGLTVKEFRPLTDGPVSLMLENDYVRGAMMIDGKSVRSPWIEEQPVYVRRLLDTADELTTFAYPAPLDRWLVAGARFDSFRVFEFAARTCDQERRGLDFRRATRAVFPWTRGPRLGCLIGPAKTAAELYRWIERSLEAGYEGICLTHGWIDGLLTNPIFTNYTDYELRPELFPNGWSDVRRLTNFARSKGAKTVRLYDIFVNTWRERNETWADRENQWELVWAPDDDSARWGVTLDPGTDWGKFVTRKIEESLLKGGFDGYLLDGPYYGDISVAEGAGCSPGTNQLIGWERQLEFYERMRALGIHGAAADGFRAFVHGMSLMTTTGYDEGDFSNKTMRDQILSTRLGAYSFTRIHRPEQAVTFIPLVSWGGGPELVPLEEHLEEYDAYLANCFGYGFSGWPYQHVPYDGPRSEAVLRRWLGFWKGHEEFFTEGYLLHVREPNGRTIDGVVHVLKQGSSGRAVLVVYNPTDSPRTESLEISLEAAELDVNGWIATSESGEKQRIADSRIEVTVPAHGATWYDLAQ